MWGRGGRGREDLQSPRCAGERWTQDAPHSAPSHTSHHSPPATDPPANTTPPRTTMLSGDRLSQEWIWEQMSASMCSGHSARPEGCRHNGGAHHHHTAHTRSISATTNSRWCDGGSRERQAAEPCGSAAPKVQRLTLRWCVTRHAQHAQRAHLLPDVHGQLEHRVVKHRVRLHIAPASVMGTAVGRVGHVALPAGDGAAAALPTPANSRAHACIRACRVQCAVCRESRTRRATG